MSPFHFANKQIVFHQLEVKFWNTGKHFLIALYKKISDLLTVKVFYNRIVVALKQFLTKEINDIQFETFLRLFYGFNAKNNWELNKNVF